MFSYIFSRQKLLKAAFLLIMSTTTSNANFSETRLLLVKIVDEDNRPVKPEIVRWWFTDNPEKKNTLTCMQYDCTRLVIPQGLSLPVTVYALASQIQENDKDCWDWYEAEVESQEPQKQIILTLSYTRTVCK